MNEQLINMAEEWAQNNPDFLDNFIGMSNEYRDIVSESGIDFDSERLTQTNKCFNQVYDLLQKAGVV